MMRWIAGLGAALVLPACGDGSGSRAAQTDPASLAPGQAPAVRIISPDSGATRESGSKVTIHAVVEDAGAVIARVEFYDDNRLIGTKSDPPYIITSGRLKAGTHELCAVAVDFDGTPTASAPVTLFVVRGDDD
jgi:hypothetical protein